MNRVFLNRVTKSFPVESGETKVVIRDLSLEILAGRFTTIVGPNGCGKTTLLNLVAGLLAQDSGEIGIQTAHGGSPQIGYVWQDYRASLLPWFSVQENITFPLRLRGVPRKERRQVAQEALSGFSTDIDLGVPVYRLSGGQQQLVCLLRSTVANPDILLLDEPLSALDQCARWTMAFRIERFWMEHPMPALFVSHDVDEAVMLADQILLMSRDGGKTAGTIHNPLPRPRNAKMLTAPEHIRCRENVIEFLFKEGAIRDRDSITNAELRKTLQHQLD